MSRLDDTLKIKEVVILGKILDINRDGYKTTTVDSSLLMKYSTSNLSDLLSLNSNIIVKSYGMGGIATPAFRGTGATHTQIDWNGINISSPMLGQSDLSLVPVGFIDDIQIYYGGASMALNSGGIGGIINLETKPVWRKENMITLDDGIGSFGQYSGLIKLKIGNVHFQSVTKVLVQAAENDFRYLNSDRSSEPVWETRKYSEVYQHGLIQEFYYRKTKNVISARIWYQSTNRNLSGSTLTQKVNTGEKQFDESLRTMLNYDIFRGSSSYSLAGVWMMNRLNYYNRLASIDSRNCSETFIIKGGLERRIGENNVLKINLNDEMNLINSDNYNQKVSRNTVYLTASVENKGAGRVGTSFLVREILDKNSFLIPDFSAGILYRIFEDKEYFVKGNISRNSKIPTLNDMFWTPGGNPALKNEYAFIYELTYGMNQQISRPLKLKYEVSIFRNTIKDMIQWHPGKYSYWTADNIQNVNSMGLESSLSLDYKYNNFRSGFKFSYSFTKATIANSNENNDISKDKQLEYIPENKANTTLILNYKIFYLSWFTIMTGKRYITVDNSKYLPGYFLNNILTGVKLKFNGNFLDINFNIDNIFNVNYQSIAYYPLPGRSYLIKILVQLVK